MGRIISFRKLVQETCWKIIWQFVLGLTLIYLIPLASISVQLNQDGQPIEDAGVLSIFFNVTSWMYIFSLLIVLISFHFGRMLKKLNFEMNLIHTNSMWLENEVIEKITVKEFRETGNSIIMMQNRIRQLLANEKQQKEDLIFQVSAASHDLKIPLTIVKGNAEFLSASAKDDQSKECLSDIVHASKQLLNYVNQLIYYSKTYYDDEAEWIDCDALDFVNLLKDEAYFIIKNQIKLNFEQSIHDDEVYHINLNLLVRAIQNILMNAMEYANQDNPEIKIRVEQDGKELKLIIWNNGSEFTEEVLNNFGKLFYRMDKARSFEDHHFGIGLSFVCRVAVLHKGRVELRNRDEGALVLMTLNCVKS